MVASAVGLVSWPAPLDGLREAKSGNSDEPALRALPAGRGTLHARLEFAVGGRWLLPWFLPIFGVPLPTFTRTKRA
jgi:hypothetical protein